MKTKNRDNSIRTAAILLLLIPLLASGGCKPKKVEQKEEVKIPVVVSKPVKGTVVKNFKTTGTVYAEDESDIGFPMGGRIVTIDVDVGDTVRAGQVLAKVDAVQLTEAANAAKSAADAAHDAVKAQERALDVARNQHEDAVNRLDKTEADYNRFKKLYEDKVVTKKEFEDIETAYKSAKLGAENAATAVEAGEYQLKMASGQAEAASAGADQAAKALSDTVLKAPYAGTIAEKILQIGEIASPGKEVFKITGQGARKVVIRVPEEYHGKVSVGENIDITFDYYPDQVVSAPISRVVADVSPDNRSFTIEALVPEGYDVLPGSFAQVEFPLETAEDVMTLPMAALLSFPDGAGVYVNKDGVAEKHLIKTGLTEGQTVQVLEGLSWDDEVVVIGNRFLSNGTKIEPKSTPDGIETGTEEAAASR